MAIRKQNRTIWFLALVILVLLFIFMIRDGKFAEILNSSTANENSANSESIEDQFGDRVSGDNSAKAISQHQFQLTLNRLAQCFRAKGATLSDSAPMQIETLFQKLQEDFGPVSHQADRWIDWHLRTREGKERRLRLEITESDEGKIGRELHYFAVDRDGQPAPLELEPEKAMNPSDDVISQMLKEGEVFTKEKAAVAFFPNQARVEYVEKDGELFEIEVFKDEHQFRCADVKFPENCQCQ